MSHFARLRPEGGFTIQELLVVLIVASLLVSFSLSLFLFMHKLVSSWERDIEMRGSVDRAVQLIALDVQRSGEVNFNSDSACVLKREAGVSVSYAISAHRVLRNGEPMFNPPGMEVGGKMTRVLRPSANADQSETILVELVGTWKDRRFAARCEAGSLPSSKWEFKHFLDHDSSSAGCGKP